jgi:TP901 family phage tail tape measure protein
MPEVADLFVTLRAVTAPYTDALVKADASTSGFVERLAAMDKATASAGTRLAALGREVDGTAAKMAAAGRGATSAAAGLGTTAKSAENAESKLASLGSKALGLGTVFAQVGKWGSIGLAGVAAASVDLGMKFQTEMTKLVTAAGAPASAVDSIKGKVLDLGTATGFTGTEIAEALYHPISAGLDLAAALQVTKFSAEEARISGASLEDTTYALSSVMKAFDLSAQDAGPTMAKLNAIVGEGDMRFQDFNASVKNWAPTAASMGISIESMGSALGYLTDRGNSAEVAATRLTMGLVMATTPSKQAATILEGLGVASSDVTANTAAMTEIMKKAGITTNQLAQDVKKPDGIYEMLRHLKTSLQDAGVSANEADSMLSKVFGGGRSDKAIMQLLQNLDGPGGLHEKYQKVVADAQSGQFEAAWEKTKNTLSVQLKQIVAGVENTGIKIGTALIPYVSAGITQLEALGRRGVKSLVDVWTIYGPSVEAKLNDAGGKIRKAMEGIEKPAEAVLRTLAVTAIPLAISSVKALGEMFGKAETAAGPLLSKLKNLADSLTSNSGALGTLTGRLQTGIGMLGDVSHAIGPLAGVVGDLAHAFAGLPGPIQLSVLSMLAMRPFQPQIKAMQDSVTSFGKAGIDAFRGVGGAIQMQQILAEQSGVSLGRVGSAMAAIEARVPVIGQMGTAFRGVYETLPETATGVERIGGALRGIGSAAAAGALTGLKSAASGLLDVMGGPWGLAIGGATTLIDYFAQKDAAAKQAVADFTAALQKDSGALGENTRALVAQKLEQAGALDTARKYGIQLSTVTDAVLGNKTAQDQISTVLQQVATHQEVVSKAQLDAGKSTTQLNADAQDLIGTYQSTNSSVNKAAQAYRNQQDATKGAADAASEAASPTGRLEGLVKTLGDSASSADQKARALHDALTLLAGGQLDVQAATAQANAAVINLNHAWQDGIDQSKGFGEQLLKADGSLNTATENGQALFTKMQDLSQQTASAVQATYDYAKANGSSSDAMKQAQAAMQSSRDALIQTAEKFGLTTDQAKNLADQMGLIPSELPITLGLKDLDPTEAGLRYVQGQSDKLAKGTTVPVSALTDQAIKDLQSVGYTVKNLDGKNLQITADTGSANSNLNYLIDQLGQVHSKHVTVTADYYVNQYGKALPMPQANGGLVQFARGGITAYASGGEQHVAQIAPAGAMRLWAEPETGGEAYIPLAPSKRSRSRTIAEQAVDALGGRIAWGDPGGGAAQMAVGRSSPLTASSGAGGTTVVVNNYFQIEGSVLAQNDLRDLVQQQMLRLGMTNSQTWQPYRRR